MKQLYYECFSGLSGDMNLGALINLGVDFECLKSELSKLGLDKEYQITHKIDEKHGIFGIKVDVIDLNTAHHKHHGDIQHLTDHDHSHSHDHLRTFGQIKEIILESELSERVKNDSIGIFELIAAAEAKVHQQSIDDVHFHEVGAIDSIIDIVGTAICMELLDVNSIICERIEIGSGFVTCAHGTMPVPAPATAEILLGIPTCKCVSGYEMTTPTGAAIIKFYRDGSQEYANEFAYKIGYGLGTRDLAIPNVVRVTLCEMQKKN